MEERISEDKFRLLPEEIREIPLFAKPCTLNNTYSKKHYWSADATALFKRWTQRSPMKLRVLNKERGVLIVDLGQIPNVGEKSHHITSVSGSLMMLSPKPLILLGCEAPKKFKPKFEGLRLPKSTAVFISSATWLNSVYFQIIDDDVELYVRMHEHLQKEFCNATNASPSFVQFPTVGISFNSSINLL